MNPAQFPLLSSQVFINPVLPESSSMEIDSCPIKFEDHFENIPSEGNEGNLIKENIIKFLTEEVTLENLLALLTTPAKLLCSLNLFYEEDFRELSIAKFFGYLTAIETQLLDQLDNLIKLESQNQTSDGRSGTLEKYIDRFRKKFCDSIIHFHPNGRPDSILNYTCFSYIPSLYKKNEEATGYYFPKKISPIAILYHLNKNENLFAPHFSLKQTLVRIEKEMHDIMGISHNEKSDLPWAPYIELFNWSREVNCFDYSISDLLQTEVLKKINKGLVHEIFSAGLPLFFDTISDRIEGQEDLTPALLSDLLDVLIKHNILHETNDYSEIFSYISKYIFKEFNCVEFSCDSREVDYVQHTFGKNELKISINPQIFSANSEGILTLYEWINSLLNAQTTMESCTLPLELLFPTSLTGKKRKRGESCVYQIHRYPLNILKNFTSIHLIGKPKQPFHPEEWNQLMNWIVPERQVLHLAIECLSENTQFPEFLDSSIVFSMNKNEAERKKQFEYLNQFTNKEKVIAVLDFENNEISLEVLLDYARGVTCELQFDFNKASLAADFDLTAFLNEISIGIYNQANFLRLICDLYRNPFTIEHIHLMVQLYGCLQNAPNILKERMIDIIDSEEGVHLFSDSSMRKVDVILDVLRRAAANKDNALFYKKMTSFLLGMTLEAVLEETQDQNISTNGMIPDPRSSTNVQEYLLECITTHPPLMEKYAKPIVKIFQQISREAPDHPLNGKITLQFLQNPKCREEINGLLSYYSMSIELKDFREGKIEECGLLLSLLNFNEVKGNLASSPKTLENLLGLLNAAFNYDQILVKQNFLKKVEGIVSYFIKKEYFTKAHLQSLLGIKCFPPYLYSILCSLKTPEVELFAKRLLSVADLFWNKIFLSNSSDENVNKLISTFIKQGWNPPARNEISTEKFRYFLIPFLSASLPHLDLNKQEWVLYILQDLGRIKPTLSQEDQEGVNQLLNYFFIRKDRTILGWDISGLTHYPVISKHLLILSFSQPERLKGWIGSPAYFDVWNVLFTDLLNKSEINEEEAFHYAYRFLRSIELKEVFQNPEIINAFMKTLSPHPLLQERLLKKSYVLSENPSKSSLKSSGYLAWHVLSSNRELSEEMLSLCTRALCDRKLIPIKFDMDLIPCKENCLGFLKAIMDVLKKAEKFTLKNHPKLLLSLWNTYLTDYALYKSNPNDKVYNTLLDHGEVIIASLLEEPSNEIVHSLDKLLDAEFTASTNVMKDVIDRLLGSNKFISIKLFDLLLAIVGRLPTLSEEAQKIYFRLSKNYCFFGSTFNHLIFQRQPLFLNKRLKYFNKIPIQGGYRIEAIDALTVPFTEENGPFISKILSKLAPLTENELFLICRGQKTHLAQCLGRELNEKEKGYLELSKYKLEGNTFQKVRRFIEKPFTPPIDVNQTSTINSLLGLYDLINFSDPRSSNYVNPSVLILEGKPIEPSEFRANIERLINNVLKREKIIAVPENDEERELFYRELHQYLAHIAHILGQQDPAACTATFLALGEIGNKCGTQYLELPGLYHSLVQQADIPLVPHWISLQLIDSSKEALNNYLFENPSQYGFMTRTALISRLKSFVCREINNALTFKVPLKDHEVRYYYALINKKSSLIYYLIETLPFNLRESILGKIGILELNSPSELLKELEKIERVLSIAWLLSYLNKYGLDLPSLSEDIGSMIEKEFKEGTESDVSKKLKKLLNALYEMDGPKTKQTLGLLSETLTGDNVLARMETIFSSDISKQILEQPVTLQDKLEILLHDRRWKYLRDKLAQHPEMFSVNVHNLKFIQHKLSEPLGIYHAYSSMKAYEDKHVEPKTKQLVAQLLKDFNLFDHHPLFVFNAIKQEISKTIPFGDLRDWFKVHHPKDMAWEDFQGVLYNEDFEFQDRWLVYMLEKMGFIVKG